MEISHHEDGSFTLSGMDGHLIDFLQAIPRSTEHREHPETVRRLFPDPLAHDKTATEEWREYIHPDLEDLFRGAREIVESDLEPLRDGAESLTIPARHVDAWLNTLNQARLALATRFGIDEGAMEEPISNVLENDEEIALFQIHLYGFLQECLIRGE